MTAKLSALIALLFIPAMWFLVGLHVLLGAIGVLGPGGLRSVAQRFTKNKFVRLFSVLLVLFGIIMFVRAGGTKMVLLVRVLGVSSFVTGGVGLIIPVLGVMVAEWIVDRSNLWFRALGLLAFGLAYLFFLATAPAPVDESAASVQDLQETVEARESEGTR